MRRKKSRKRREWNGFPSEEGGGVEDRDASTWKYGKGGKKLTTCEKERDRIQRLSLQTLPLLLRSSPRCAAQSPRKESDRTLLDGRMGFVLHRSNDLMPPNSNMQRFTDVIQTHTHTHILPGDVSFQGAYPDLQDTVRTFIMGKKQLNNMRRCH